jgi:hypothetical protein
MTSPFSAGATPLPSSVEQRAPPLQAMDNSTSSLFGLPISPSPLESRRFLNSTVFVPALFAFIALYHLLAPMYSTPKQLSWILTTTSSAVMTISSLPFILDYITARGSVVDVRLSPVFAYIANRIFQAYLIAWVLEMSSYFTLVLTLR